MVVVEVACGGVGASFLGLALIPSGWLRLRNVIRYFDSQVHTLENVVPAPATVGQPPRKDPQMEYSMIVPQSEQKYRTAKTFTRAGTTYANNSQNQIYCALSSWTLKLNLYFVCFSPLVARTDVCNPQQQVRTSVQRSSRSQ
ncbi:hypothetical protein Tco_0316635 [Tanacetum coccineum]